MEREPCYLKLSLKKGCKVSEENLIELHYIIKIARHSLEIKDDCTIPTFLPYQPLLLNIVNLTKKGCSSYSKLLRKKTNLSTPLVYREQKWHNELQCTFGTEFWNKTYSMVANIKHENKIKYLQFQINRNCLFTNYKVNKFKPQISPLCTFCCHLDNAQHFELVSHLFYSCYFVLKLWQEIKTWLATLDINLPIDKTVILFGNHEQASSSVSNFLILCAKGFIWKSKFTTKQLSLILFQVHLYQKLNDIKNAYILSEKQGKFEQWNDIYVYLSRLPECTMYEATMPLSE